MHAARAIEREEAGELALELVLDCRAHHPAGPEQPGLDGVGFDVEQRRGLLDAEALDVAQHEDGAEDVGQRVDRLLEELSRFLACHFGLRIGLRLAELDDLGAAALLGIDRREFGGGPPLSQSSDRLIDDDAGQPGLELRVAAKATEMGEGVHIGRLHHVLGLGIVVDDGPGGPEQALVVAPHQHPDRVLVAIPRQRHERGIRTLAVVEGRPRRVGKLYPGHGDYLRPHAAVREARAAGATRGVHVLETDGGERFPGIRSHNPPPPDEQDTDGLVGPAGCAGGI